MRRICLRPDGSMVGRVVIKDVFLVAAVEVLGFEIKRRPGWCRSIYPHRLSQGHHGFARSEEHTSELQSLVRISYAVFCLKKKKQRSYQQNHRCDLTYLTLMTNRRYTTILVK